MPGTGAHDRAVSSGTGNSPTSAPDAPALPSYPDLAGRVVLVTGGSGGIGAATCLALASSGASVAVNGRRPGPVEAVVDTVRHAGGTVIAAPGDCTDPGTTAALVEHVEQELGPLDVLCTFAGGGRTPQPVATIDPDEWREDVERNLTATFLTVRSALPGMIERGRGAIITMASGAARLPGGAPIAYAAAKAGVVNFTQQAAHELGRHGIRVNCIAPATVLTDAMAELVPEERQRALVAAYPLGRLGRPRDVASAALFLASDASSWITGITLDVAGGQVMR